MKEAPEGFRAGLAKAGPLTIAGLAANTLNVGVTVLVARLLTTRGYGVLNQLNGVFLIVSMPGYAVAVAVVRRVTRSPGSAIAGWAEWLHRRGRWVIVGWIGTVVTVGPFLARALNEGNAIGLEAMLVGGAIWVLLCIDRGLLQAHREYGRLGLNLLVEGVMKGSLMVVLIAVGLGPKGGGIGVLLGEVVTAIHARRGVRRAWGVGEPHRQGDPILRDLGVALGAFALIAVLQNTDVIILGRSNPGASGAYAAISVAAKALVFAALVVGGYMQPEAAIRWERGEHALRQLLVSLGILALPEFILVVVAAFAPRLLLSLVFSHRYLSASGSLLVLALAMTALSTTVVMAMYLLAIGRRWPLGVLGTGAIALVVAVWLAHGDPAATADADLAVQATVAVALAGGFSLVHRSVR